jgi:hypothetical protein
VTFEGGAVGPGIKLGDAGHRIRLAVVLHLDEEMAAVGLYRDGLMA